MVLGRTRGMVWARGKLACAGGGGGSLEPPEGGGGVWQWGSCDRTLGKVPIFFSIFAIFSLNSGTNSRRSLRGIKGHGQGLGGSSLVCSNVMLGF